MKFLKNYKTSELTTLIISTIIIAILFILSSYLFRNYQPDITTTIKAQSLTGMFVYILVFALSIVLVPISAIPLIPIGTKLWGITITTALSTIGWTMGAMIAFYLARKLGKKYVAKVIAIEKIEKFEKLIPEKNIFWTIFFFRTVTPFDGLSYILGLITKVSTKTFFWATFLGLIPFCLVISFLGSLPTTFLISGLILAGIFFTIGIYNKQKTKK